MGRAVVPPDTSAVGILSSASPTAPVVIVPDITGLQPVTIAVPGPNPHVPFSPLSIPATFTYDYKFVVSVSQSPAGSPFDASLPVGYINVINPTTSAVVSTTAIQNTFGRPATVFSVVSTNTALSSILVAVNCDSLSVYSIYQFDMTAAGSGAYNPTVSANVTGSSMVTDLRTSPNGTQVLFTLADPTSVNVFVWDLPSQAPLFASATTTTQLTARYGGRSSPPTVATNVAISGAWTSVSGSPGSNAVVISTGLGNVPDTVILYTVPVAPGALVSVGSAMSTAPQGSPPSTPLKIIAENARYVVGRTGTSYGDEGTIASLLSGNVSSDATPLAGDDGNGIQDLVVAPNGIQAAVLFNSGRTVNIAGLVGAVTLPGGAVGARLGFSRDSNWLFIGNAAGSAVWAVNAVLDGQPIVALAGNPDTYFLTGTSSADLSGQ